MADFQPNFNRPYMPYNVSYGNTPVSSKGIENIKKQDNIAGKVADKYDPTGEDNFTPSSILYSLLMSAGFVNATNWAMKSKKLTDAMSQMEAFQNSRLYRAGAWLDNTAPVKWMSDKAGKAKNAISKVPVPEFIKEIYRKTKVGAISPWDKTGMYSLGKTAEAMNETAVFFSQLGKEALQTLKLTPDKYDELSKLLEKVRLGKIDNVEAFKQMEPILKDVSAATLKKLNVPVNKFAAIFNKLLGTKPDLSLSVSKAKFFAGQSNLGPVGKALGKAAALFGEASGGGVLGGSTALLMNAMFLMTAFSSAQKAEKGDKLKTFMEDYIGFTLGGYLMSIVVGIAFNKIVHNAELGMKLDVAKELGKKLGLTDAKRVQNVVIDYNKEFKKNFKLNKIIDKFDKGKVVEKKGGIFGWVWRKLTGKITFDKVEKVLKKNGIEVASMNPSDLRAALNKAVDGKDFKFFAQMRKDILGAMKSDITFASIFKKGNGGFFNRLGRWVVQKPFATACKLLSTGRYTLLKNGNKIGNSFRFFKRFGGGVGRMILVGFVLVEPFRKMFVKLSHAIFGKPKHSALDEEEKKAEETNKPQVQPAENKKSQNLVDLYMNGLKEKSFVKEQPHVPYLKADSATYIPNQVLGNESSIDPALTEDLIARRDFVSERADRAEKNAKDLLARI